MIPGIVAAASALASSGISALNTREANQDRKANSILAEKRSIANRKNEDSDKVKSLKRAGLNPNLAYSGNTTPVSGNVADVETSNSADILAKGGEKVADLLQSQPSVDANVENLNEQNNAIKANIEKTKEETEHQRLLNEELRGANGGSRFKLQALGFNPSDIKVEQSTGFLRSIDFGDEVHTKGEERKLRRIVAQLNTEFNNKIATDESMKTKYQDALTSQLDSMVKDNELKSADLTLKRQDISMFALNKEEKQRHNYGLMLDNINKQLSNSKLMLDMDAIQANTQLAKESSWNYIFTNYMSALRSNNAEQIAKWNLISAIKGDSFGSLQKMLGMTSFGDALSKIVSHEMNTNSSKDSHSYIQHLGKYSNQFRNYGDINKRYQSKVKWSN